MQRIALIGAAGQLGSDIVRRWQASGLAKDEAILLPLTHSDIEVCDQASVRAALEALQPTCVINTAAYHRVDDCEDNPSSALAVNIEGVKHIAEACQELGALMVQVGTDHVFDGRSTSPYDEYASPCPANMYGVSKLAGEQVVRYLLPDRHIILRTSGLFGVSGASGKGGNFVETMRRLAEQGRDIRVVDDQVLSPSHTADVASLLLEIIQREGRGTFHVTNSGECSWFDFARTIFDRLNLSPSLSPVSSAEYGARAPRPAYSVLANRRLRELGLRQPRPWSEALDDYLAARTEAASV